MGLSSHNNLTETINFKNVSKNYASKPLKDPQSFSLWKICQRVDRASVSFFFHRSPVNLLFHKTLCTRKDCKSSLTNQFVYPEKNVSRGKKCQKLCHYEPFEVQL